MPTSLISAALTLFLLWLNLLALGLLALSPALAGFEWESGVPMVTQIYQVLRDEIIAIRLKPGQLVSEKEIAARLNAEQKELLEKFGESMGKAAKKHSPNENSWIDNVKKFFEDMKS